ncbi:MAG TPA: DUF502 domain-containing protein [Stellaceae bacterium]|nr:DUF502 domain-containing protein [Stellaceae bacterium]
MTEAGQSAPPPPESTRLSRFGGRLRAYFIAGILVTGPIIVTLWIAWGFVDLIDRSVAKLLPQPLDLVFKIPGLGLIVAVVALTLLGWLAAGYAGRGLLRLSDMIMTHMPVVSGIYSALKQLFETVLANRSNSFREVVMVEWPSPGMWTVAFVTSRAEGEMAARAGDDLVGVYVPTTPNPTSGYLIYLPRAKTRPLAMSVEEGLMLVISIGIVTPASYREAGK